MKDSELVKEAVSYIEPSDPRGDELRRELFSLAKRLERTEKASRKAVKLLKKTSTGDNEIAHSMADDVLLEFLEQNGFTGIAKEWRNLDDACGGFWYA